MAAMSTALTVFSSNGNSRTYTRNTHTAVRPRLVLQKRKVPVGNGVIAEDTITVLDATVDAAGVALPQRVLFTATVRRPINGVSSDVTSGLATFRDIIASDEFGALVTSQNWVKA